MRPHNSAESLRTSSNSNSQSALKQIISAAYAPGSFIMLEEDKGYDHCPSTNLLRRKPAIHS